MYRNLIVPFSEKWEPYDKTEPIDQLPLPPHYLAARLDAVNDEAPSDDVVVGAADDNETASPAAAANRYHLYRIRN